LSDRSLRRWLIAGSVSALALLVALGFLFWRDLPSIIPRVGSAVALPPFNPPTDLPAVLPTIRLDGIRVALIEEPENIRVTPPQYYAQAQARWRTMLRHAGAIISAPGQADVLIVAEAQCLGPQHRRLLAAHLARGGGIVSTGALGARAGQCQPLADTLLAQMIGLARGGITQAEHAKRKSLYAVTLGETVLAAHLPPGVRFELSPARQIRFQHPGREVFYSDYERQPIDSLGNADAAVVRAQIDRGRVVAFGFSIQDYDDSWSELVGATIMANAIQWAAARPIFQLAPWPQGKRAAAVLAHDVEADFSNARSVLTELARYNLPGTSFIVGHLADADRRTTDRLLQSQEIGTHTHHHWPLDTLSAAGLLNELKTSKQQAERIVGKPVLGMRPPLERFTLAALQHWADLGGDYVFASNDLRTAAPELVPLRGDSLILLARVSEDDFQLLQHDALRDRALMVRRLVEQVDQVIAYRGLYMFSYHSHILAQKELLPVLGALAHKLQQSPEVWTTTAGEVARWWRARAALQLEQLPDRVRITNQSDAPVSRVVLIIDLPSGERIQVSLPELQAGAAIVVSEAGDILEAVASPRRAAP
jgi:peptidoglycan/xylan/chitin deacetylase (PgdA/CDA1 family)